MKFIRIWGAGIFVIILVLMFIFSQFLLDKILKNSLENTLSKALSTKVLIDDFDIDIFQTKLHIKGLKILNKKDPSKNLIEVGNIVLDLNATNLFAWKKVDIENGKIEEIKFGTNSGFEGKISAEKSAKATPQEEKPSVKVPEIKLPQLSTEEILNKENLKTKQVVAFYKEKILKTKEKWEKTIKEFPSLKELEELKKEVKEIQNLTKNPTDLSNISKAKEKISSLKKKIEENRKKIALLKKELQNDKNLLKSAIKDINQAVKEDYNYLKNKYSFDKEGGLNLIGTLIGEKYKNYIEKGLEIYKTVAPYLSGKEKAEEEKVRLKGEYVIYKDLTNIPDFILRQSSVSIWLNHIKLTGTAKDFSDNPKLYKKPAVLTLNSKNIKGLKEANLSFTFDRTSKTAVDTANIYLREVKISGIQNQIISIKDAVGNISGNIKVIDLNQLKGKIKVNLNNVKPQVLVKGEIGRFIKQTLANTESFFVYITISGNIDKPVFSIKSDIDEKLNKGLKQALSRAKREYEKKLNKILSDYKQTQIKNLSKDMSFIKEYENLLNIKDKEYKNLLKELLGKNIFKTTPSLPVKLPF